MVLEIRPAAPGDAAFLSWVIFSAGWAHVKRGIGEVIIERPERDCAEFLERLVVTRT